MHRNGWFGQGRTNLGMHAEGTGPEWTSPGATWGDVVDKALRTAETIPGESRVVLAVCTSPTALGLER